MIENEHESSHRYGIFPIISIDPIDNTFLAHIFQKNALYTHPEKCLFM